MWLLSTSSSKLKHFIEHGSKIELNRSTEAGAKSSNSSGGSKESTPPLDNPISGRATPEPFNVLAAKGGTPGSCPDAEQRIPNFWLTVDRVLDVKIWSPGHAKKTKQPRRQKKRIDSEEEGSDPVANNDLSAAFQVARTDGQQPDQLFLQDVDSWEEANGRELSLNDVHLVVWAYLKWDDLAYDQCT
jgi:hypothetical protein